MSFFSFVGWNLDKYNVVVKFINATTIRVCLTTTRTQIMFIIFFFHLLLLVFHRYISSDVRRRFTARRLVGGIHFDIFLIERDLTQHRVYARTCGYSSVGAREKDGERDECGGGARNLLISIFTILPCCISFSLQPNESTYCFRRGDICKFSSRID